VFTTIFQSLPQYAIASLVLAFAQAVYVLFGFGSGLIALGLLALVFPSIQDIVVLLLLVSLPAEVFVAWQSRRRIAWREVALITAGVVVGVPLGTWILRVGHVGFLIVLLGWFLIATGGAFLLLPAERKVRWPRWSAPPTGLLGGLLSGMFGTGGPPVIIWYRLGGAGKAAFRGNMMAIWMIVSLTRLPSYGIAGLLTVPRLWSALAVAPAVLLGGWAGHRIHIEISERAFQRSVAVALAIIGGLLLLKR
jgi:uncharacterized membrane protein YfcA